MNVMLKLVALYRIISEATDEEISLMLGYAQNIRDSRPKASKPDHTGAEDGIGG